MKILLNLLPQEHKQATERHVRFRMIVAQGSVMLLLAGFYCTILFGVSFLLSSQLENEKDTSKQTESQAQALADIAAYEAAFRDANTKSSELANILDKHVSWTEFFHALDESVPAGVTVTNMLSKDNELTISGTAKNRETLLDFQNRMNDSSCFSDASVPLSDLLEKQDIDFALSANIQDTCLLLAKRLEK